jgi:hypothetical protein
MHKTLNHILRAVLIAGAGVFYGSQLHAQGTYLVSYTCDGQTSNFYCYKIQTGLAGTTWSTSMAVVGIFYRSETSSWIRKAITRLTSNGCSSITMIAQGSQTTDVSNLNLGDGVVSSTQGIQAGVPLLKWTRTAYFTSTIDVYEPSGTTSMRCL